jgi:hypothetical protein
MKKYALLLLLPLSASLFAADPIFTRSDPDPAAIDLGFESPPWLDAGDFQEADAEANLKRWETQAAAGRARAAALIGRYWLERVPQDPAANCAKAIDAFQKAAKLGSNEAPAWLGHLYRRLDCPQRDVKLGVEWLRKAVPLATFGTAAELYHLYAAEDTPEHDATLAYAYGRVAAAGNELTTGELSSEDFLKNVAAKLDARQLKTANELAGKLLAAIAARRDALTAPPPEEKLKATASGSAAGSNWNLALVGFDDLRECAANTAGNCKGMRRVAFVDAANRSAEYLRCKLTVEQRDFATGTRQSLDRDTILPPQSTRRLVVGRIGEVANKDLRAECAPIAGLAANVAAGTCKAVTTGVPSIDDFYPAGSRAREEQGSVRLYAFMDQKEGHPALVELMGSSGYPELDRAGIRMGTYMAFRTDCDQGYLPFVITFKLKD